MIETAPSGAYVEDWRLLPESRSFAAHLTKRDAAAATCLYVAGEQVIYARNRTVDLPSDKSLVELASVLNTKPPLGNVACMARLSAAPSAARMRTKTPADFGS